MITIDLEYLFEVGNTNACSPVLSIVDADGNPPPSYITLDTSVVPPQIIVSADMKNSDYVLNPPAHNKPAEWNKLYWI